MLLLIPGDGFQHLVKKRGLSSISLRSRELIIQCVRVVTLHSSGTENIFAALPAVSSMQLFLSSLRFPKHI